MSRISTVFDQPGKALIAYLTVGYPSIELTEEAVVTLADGGCDIIELGIPFSDPLADGATIQRASQQALARGITPEKCLQVAASIRRRVSLPLTFMSYYNPILSFGLEDFCRAAAAAGIDGLIIPDLPPEEGTALEDLTGKMDMDLIYLLAPSSTDQRISLVAERCRGFIYLVSLTGVTGARQQLPEGLEEFVGRVRRQAPQPLCVGFGVSTPEQAKRVAGIADGVIVGSRLIQLIEEDTSLSLLGKFVRSLRGALG